MNLKKTVDWMNRNPVDLRQIRNKMRFGRNDVCPFCVSGMKYKHCCINRINAATYKESPIARKELEKEARYYKRLYERVTKNV